VIDLNLGRGPDETKLRTKTKKKTNHTKFNPRSSLPHQPREGCVCRLYWERTGGVACHPPSKGCASTTYHTLTRPADLRSSPTRGELPSRTSPWCHTRRDPRLLSEAPSAPGLHSYPRSRPSPPPPPFSATRPHLDAIIMGVTTGPPPRALSASSFTRLGAARSRGGGAVGGRPAPCCARRPVTPPPPLTYRDGFLRGLSGWLESVSCPGGSGRGGWGGGGWGGGPSFDASTHCMCCAQDDTRECAVHLHGTHPRVLFFQRAGQPGVSVLCASR